jgi:hypothetical protein
MNKYRKKAMQTALLVKRKQKAYGDSFSKSGKIMRILYPKGVNHDQLDDALVMVRVIDKMFRIATSKKAFGENPWEDILGYALLASTR